MNAVGHPVLKLANIILDQPTAAPEQAEVGVPGREILTLRKVAGVIFVPHRLDEVIRICDRVVIMRHGALMSGRSIWAVTCHGLFRAMVDDAPADAARAFGVRGLTIAGKF